MDRSNIRWLPCKIENAGFSSERRFEVDLQGNGKAIGTAYIAYFLDADKNKLQEGHPPYGQELNGYVAYRIVSQDGDKYAIEFPGTDIFHVPEEALEHCLKPI